MKTTLDKRYFRPIKELVLSLNGRMAYSPKWRAWIVLIEGRFGSFPWEIKDVEGATKTDWPTFGRLYDKEGNFRPDAEEILLSMMEDLTWTVNPQPQTKTENEHL